MAIRVVESLSREYKIRKIFAQRKLLNFENLNSGVKKCQNLTITESIFYFKNDLHLSHFFSLKNINSGVF